MKGILAIYDEEAEYANRLMEYIKRKYKNPIQVRVFTNLDNLKNFVGQAPIHILLLHENFPVEEIKHNSIENICLLSEGISQSDNSSYPRINKYQSAENILQELFSYFPVFKVKDRDSDILKDKKIISVFSFGEETLRQLFSYSLAKLYSIKKKTLYINLNTISVISKLSGNKRDKDLSEVIYYLKQDNPNLTNRIRESIIKKDTLDYMEGVSFGPDIYELTAEDLDKWLDILMLNTDYEVIIFDIGTFYLASLEVLHHSGQIFWPAEKNRWEQLKYEHFHGQMEWSGNQEIINKVIYVSISEEEKHQLLNLSWDSFEVEIANWTLPGDYITE